MDVITAPELVLFEYTKISVFLAGGITNCRNWQREVIEYLRQYDINNSLNLRVFNPRRDNFDITKDDPEKQIRWEYATINYRADIFSMYFCNSESDQPICMYELGMHLGKLSEKIRGDVWDHGLRTIISVEDGYKRANDVLIQTDLVLGSALKVNLHATPESHAQLIIDEYNI